MLFRSDGFGPDVSRRGNAGSCGGASSSTSIVAEVNRIAGPPGMGPGVLSAAARAMIGITVDRGVKSDWLEVTRATASVDVTASMRLKLRDSVASDRFVVATERLGCGPWLSTRDGLSVAGAVLLSAPESFVGRAGSSASGATFSEVEIGRAHV